MSPSHPASARRVVDPRRIRAPAGEPYAGRGGVVYWMSRDQRAADNWALLHAQNLALAARAPLDVVFCLVPEFLGATRRQYDFMLRGLAEVEGELRRHNIGFHVLVGAPAETLPRFMAGHGAGALVADVDPLRIKRKWRVDVARAVEVPYSEVDAHNIVPVWEASDHAEYGAYTLRPKIRKLLPEFLLPIPKLKVHPVDGRQPAPLDWSNLGRAVKADDAVAPVDWLRPGASAARRMLDVFLEERLARYDRLASDPNAEVQSELSPYLHFGQMAAQRVALDVAAAGAPVAANEAYLEQLVVRRELADNYCLYNPAYDRLDGVPAWARRTLDRHRGDVRSDVYGRAVFEDAGTHDPLWNAAQREMRQRGKMHNYMRMYWAKKILEWTATPEEAFETAIYLNDRYELDGRDPNGYVGVAWSVGGLHDRPWSDRAVFGQIRYMNDSGCRRKFDVARYVARYGRD